MTYRVPGTGPNQAVSLNSSGALPALNGSNLTGVQGSPTGVYGDGSDGAVIAVTGPLTADVVATTYVVPNGVTVSAAGWRINATTSITIASGGHISFDGADGTNGVDGGAGGITAGAGHLSAGNSGGNSGGAGGVSGCMGTGSGGTGGDGDAGTGGAGGVQNGPARSDCYTMPKAALGDQIANTAGQGGTGNSGGGGGDDLLGTFGGGGGASGTWGMLAAPSIVNNGSITNRGGKGGNGDPAGNTGGGGGGGGGLLVTVGTYTGTAPDLSGGVGGAKGGTGSVGSAGSVGVWCRLAR